MAERLYQNEEWLRREYHGNGRTLSDMADECGVTGTTIGDWMDRHGIERRDQKAAQQASGAYTDKGWLKTEYVDKARSMKDIGDECGVTSATILKWLRRFGIDTRKSTDHLGTNYVTLIDTPRGYRRLDCRHKNGTDRVYVHQLLAIAEGADPHKVFSNGEWHVHHKNGLKWDNRPGNIDFIKGSEHLSMHYAEREKTETGEVV